MGNSEVGHQNLGAGRVVDQESVRITKAVRDGSFFDIEALRSAVERDAGRRRRGASLRHRLRRRSPRPARPPLRLPGAVPASRHGPGLPPSLHRRSRLGSVHRRRLLARRPRRSAPSSASAAWRRSSAATTRWTATTAGSGCSGPTTASPAAARAGRRHFDRYASVDEAMRDYYDHPAADSQQGDEFVTPRTVGGPAERRGSRTATR